MLAQKCIFAGLIQPEEDHLMKFRLSQIAEIIGGKIEGDGNLEVATISSIEQAQEGSITFLSNPKYEKFLYETSATGIIIGANQEVKKEVKPTLIRVEDPYTSFTTLLEAYERILTNFKTGIEQPSFQSDTAKYGEGVYLGAFSYVGENVKIGENCKIFPHVFIGDNTIIGDNTVLYSGVKVYHGSLIGNNCIIHSGAVIGSDGFGFAPQADNTYRKIPQLGKAIIEDNVEIGANTVVDRATFDSTIVKKGAKLDNLIQIAHNVHVGENTAMAAQTGISGSSKVGKNCQFGGQSGIIGHLHIPDGTKVQAQSGIIKAPKVPNTSIFGYPAIGYNDFIRSYGVFKKLPKIDKQLKDIQTKIDQLTSSQEE